MKDYKEIFKTLGEKGYPYPAGNIWVKVKDTDEYKSLQELVERAIPTELKDPYYEDGIVESGYCPNCGLEQDDGDKDSHCRDCGQALDWS